MQANSQGHRPQEPGRHDSREMEQLRHVIRRETSVIQAVPSMPVLGAIGYVDVQIFACTSARP